MDVTALQAALDRVAAPFVRGLGLRVTEAQADHATLVMPVTPALVHGGGVVCGQALMAAADTAMVVAMMSGGDADGFRPMTTVQLQTSFLRPVPGNAAHVTVRCRVLRRGRALAFGEVILETPDGRLAAHATTTYTLL
jgi:uncharacterized protein (TIGR00369 family)